MLGPATFCNLLVLAIQSGHGSLRTQNYVIKHNMESGISVGKVHKLPLLTESQCTETALANFR